MKTYRLIKAYDTPTLYIPKWTESRASVGGDGYVFSHNGQNILVSPRDVTNTEWFEEVGEPYVIDEMRAQFRHQFMHGRSFWYEFRSNKQLTPEQLETISSTVQFLVNHAKLLNK